MRAREAGCFDISGIAISCGAANVLVLVHPEEWLVMSAAALVLDWHSSVGIALFRISVVKVRLAISAGPESVVLRVEDVLLGKHVVDEFLVAFHQLSWARTSGIHSDKGILLVGPLPRVFDEFADAFVAVVLSHASLALFVRLAFRVEGVFWSAHAHFGQWSVTEKIAVAAVSPVFSLVESVIASQAVFLPELLGHRFQIVVATFLVQLTVDFLSA